MTNKLRFVESGNHNVWQFYTNLKHLKSSLVDTPSFSIVLDKPSFSIVLGNDQSDVTWLKSYLSAEVGKSTYRAPSPTKIVYVTLCGLGFSSAASSSLHLKIFDSVVHKNMAYDLIYKCMWGGVEYKYKSG